jgi:hypothetical protein
VTEAEKKRIADQRAENVRIQKEKIREGGENVKSKLTKENMIRALEIASFFIPAGAAFNAIRLGYKAYKAGKKVSQFSKIGKNNIAQLKAKRDAAQKAGDTASVKLYNKQLQKAGGQAQGKVNTATAAQFQAGKTASRAIAGAAATGAAAIGVGAASGKNKRMQEAKASQKPQTSEKPKTGGSTTAADRASAIRNSGQMLAKKAKVEKKPNDYSTIMKRNLNNFEQAFADARKAKQDVFTFKGKKYSTKVKK